jgi:hypothetical protein
MTALIADDFRENLIIDRLCCAIGLQFGLQTPYRTSVRFAATTWTDSLGKDRAIGVQRSQSQAPGCD